MPKSQILTFKKGKVAKQNAKELMIGPCALKKSNAQYRSVTPIGNVPQCRDNCHYFVTPVGKQVRFDGTNDSMALTCQCQQLQDKVTAAPASGVYAVNLQLSPEQTKFKASRLQKHASHATITAQERRQQNSGR